MREARRRRAIAAAQVLGAVTPWGTIRHLKVWRHDGHGGSICRGIPWDDLQALKDEMLGVETLAVEVYPPADLLVNEANMRHLWEVPDPGLIPFGLHPSQRG
ncbi:MAG: hypothetical protein KKA73_18565 [Chloroflexi bacterium]|nr:hypothetical protein [Chloroflexota bacterium]MBU1749692.1 hypothetical protein [Chloroflexota bacterium]